MSTRLAAGTCLALVFAITAGLGYFRYWAKLPLRLPDEGLRLEIAAGDSLSSVSASLAGQDTISHPRLLNLWGKLSGADQRVRRGEYLLTPGTTPTELLERLQSGDTIRYLVTFPEGIRVRDALEILHNSDGIVPTLDGEADPLLLRLVSPATVIEGFFLPETYQYQRGDSDFQIMQKAHRAMRKGLDEAWAVRHAELPYETRYELLIMASIIEKETGLASERAQIGGVFIRRLLRGMRLQTDPTVIYGLGQGFDGNLRRSHLRDETNPYNTYRRFGLPPGPIAMPGKDALLAAAKPAAGEALYFVAKGDGSHQFSDTLTAHELAVQRYQLTRKSNYRSSVRTAKP